MPRPRREINKLDRFGMQETLRALVDGSGLSRYEISKRTGIAESVLSRTYNGGRIPTVDIVKEVAKAVGAKATVTVNRRVGTCRQGKCSFRCPILTTLQTAANVCHGSASSERYLRRLWKLVP